MVTQSTITPEQIKTDENFLCGLELTDHNFSLYLVYTGGMRIKYYAFLFDKLLFDAADYKPATIHDYDSIKSAVTLLGWLTVQPGDTDKDFFKGYTPEQMVWAKSYRCETIKGLCNSFEDKDKKTIRYFNKHFIV